MDQFELRALEALSVDARLAALKVKSFAWVDLQDDDSLCSALVAISVRPSELHGQWDEFKSAVKALRDGRA